jgi:hypothetical protein
VAMAEVKTHNPVGSMFWWTMEVSLACLPMAFRLTMEVQPGDILTVPWRQQVIGAIALDVLTTPPIYGII